MRYLRERLTPPLPSLPRAEMAPERACCSRWTCQKGPRASRAARHEDSPLRAGVSRGHRTPGCCRAVRHREDQGHCCSGCVDFHGKRTDTARRCRVRRAVEGQIRQMGRPIRVPQRNTGERGTAASLQFRADRIGPSPFRVDAHHTLGAGLIPKMRQENPVGGSPEGRGFGETPQPRQYAEVRPLSMERQLQPRRAALALRDAGGARA